ncbi:hypothetical protein ACP70R_042466 [Stipagrostis hirtigluma subsp. patula]
MASLPDPSTFAVSLAAGCVHILNSVLGFLDGAATRNPLAAVSLTLPVLVAYLLFATLAFAVRVAGGVYAHIVAHGGGGGGLTDLAQAAVLGSVANVAIKLAIAFFIFQWPRNCSLE